MRGSRGIARPRAARPCRERRPRAALPAAEGRRSMLQAFETPFSLAPPTPTVEKRRFDQHPMRARAPPSLRVNLTLASSPARVTLSYRFATLFASQIIFPRGNRFPTGKLITRVNQIPAGNLIADQTPTGKPFSRGEHGHANGNQFPTGKTIARESTSHGETVFPRGNRTRINFPRGNRMRIKLPRGKRLRT